MAESTAPRRIGFILTPDYALMSLATAVEPLRAANHLAERALYETLFFSARGGFAPSTCGGGFESRPLAEAGAGLDLVFLVAGGNPMLFEDPAVIRRLRWLRARGIPLGGISGGSAILARAGLMAGRRFTVHWRHIDVLADFSAELMIERALYVIDRDRYSCAGGVAALDMMCALIAQEHGAPFARAVSDWFIHPRVRTANEPQRAGPGERFDLRHPVLEAAVGLMTSHLADPLSPAQLATLTGVSQRQLQRLFGAHLGQSITAFYRDLRLDKADELLMQSALPVIEIAASTGFASAAHFSRCYARRFGLPPRARRGAAQGGGRPA
ncbi:GlxA family transcriptional regulator [Amaricoccus solimangrovi]|uniref:GlxA family transcriptional regulator n=1 Tax=Amaricoccus solimangrovi TaxID=2589815 RepID=A0A501WQT3_9RHOB|nr:GlxA family transcriptional regulator [Amaricoccus solimangrovi]TPE51718.1 GlxA family transcriptional regulator [Amaricoccus solimangrovi]